MQWLARKINIKSSPEINLDQDFAHACEKEIYFEARGFDDVRVTFDRYLQFFTYVPNSRFKKERYSNPIPSR